MKGKFPHYRYHDIVEAEHQLVTEALGIKHLRLVMGSSMGGMQTWMWGEMYPDLMDGLVPIASQPIGISGRNWINRRIRIEAIKHDPDYNNGFLREEPDALDLHRTDGLHGHRERLPDTASGADTRCRRCHVQEAGRGRRARPMPTTRALRHREAVMDYDPSKDLEKIKARLMAINLGLTTRPIRPRCM